MMTGSSQKHSFRLSNFIGLYLFTCLGLPSTSIAGYYPLKSLQQMGVQKKITYNGAKLVHEFYDTRSKKTLIYQYDEHNRVEFIEVRNSLGITIEKTRFLPKRLWKLTENQLNEWYIDPSGRPIHRISDPKGKRKPILLTYEPDLDQAVCEKPLDKDVNKVEDLVKDLEPQMFHHLGEAKIKTDGCNNYAGGSNQLMKEMQEAINTGAECLAGTSPESKLEATKLLAYFENKSTTVNIFCAETDEKVKITKDKRDSVSKGTLARALIPPEEKAPGMIINISDIKNTNANERKSTLFHEMLHWLGILHSESFDTPYLADSCCFTEDKTSAKATKACELLKKSPRPGIDSKEYLSSFTEVMLLDYRSFIPMNLIKKNTAKELSNPPIDLSAEFEANQKIRKYGNITSDVHAQVLKNLDPNLKEPDDYKEDESLSGRAAVLTGDLVSMMYKKTDYETFASQAEALKTKYQELLASAETPEAKAKLKEDIEKCISDYKLLSFGMPAPKDLSKPFAYEVWDSLKKDL